MEFLPQPVLREKHQLSKILMLLKGTGAFIAGGFARYCFTTNPLPASDIDIFTGNQDTYKQAATQLDKFFLWDWESEVSSTYLNNERKINLIKPFDNGEFIAAGSREWIISKFDMTVSECYVLDEDTIMASPACVEDSNKGIINFTNLNNPIGSIYRSFKYCSKGFKIEVPQVEKLFRIYDTLPQEKKEKVGQPLSESGGSPVDTDFYPLRLI